LEQIAEKFISKLELKNNFKIIGLGGILWEDKGKESFVKPT